MLSIYALAQPPTNSLGKFPDTEPEGLYRWVLEQSPGK